MQEMPVLIFGGMILMLMADILPVFRETPPDSTLAAFYEDCLNDVISECEKHASLKDSKHDFIRRYASMAARKAGFCKQNKIMLINYLIENDIGKNPHLVEYYLNRKFFEMCRPKKPEKLRPL